ncbi:MAG: sugar-binding domain-containing protein [Bacteroidota bacterium]
MKHISLVVIVSLLSTNSSLKAQGFGTSEKIEKWYFNYGDIELGGRENLDHSQWTGVDVPHDWSVTFPASPDNASCTGYLPGGTGWYRTELQIETRKNKRYYLYFGGVYNNSEVYINGKWLGKRPNGYVSFYYEITDYLKNDGKNVVAVKVDHSEDFDSRWYTGSGIYRDVFLITANTIHLAPWGTFYTTKESGNDALVNIMSEISGSSTSKSIKIKQELVDASGKVVASTSYPASLTGENSTQLKLKNPNLWTVESPYLYRLNTTLFEGKTILDKTTTNVGIRYLKFDANKGFALNGQWMKIKGVCLHHDAGVLGSAVPKEVWRERVLRLKEIGVNGIRMSHNPQATDLYDVCDEQGMLVMDEAFDEWEYPKKKWIEGWNVGTPGFQGAANYFREWGKKDLESIVLRNRNHPSIIMWSIGNEVDYPNDPYSHEILSNAEISQYFVRGYLKDQPHANRLGDIAKELVPIVKSLDNSRPVTAALAGVIMSNETEYPAALDITGYNYTEIMYDMDHKKYPDRVIYGSETRHDLDSWKAVRDNDFIFGQFIWTGFDYLGEAGIWPSRGFTTGMIDLANNIKPRGYFRKSLWSKEPMIYLGTYLKPEDNKLSIDAPDIWNYKEGEMIRVVAYTNTEEAALFLNGEKVGKTKEYDDHTGIIYWDVPFTAGELKAVGYNKGSEVANHILDTSLQPKTLSLKDWNTKSLKPGETAILQVQALDENGNLAKLSSNEISVAVIGNGTLKGIENASNNVAENYTDNHHRLLNGKATVYIKASKSGPLEVEITSPYLNGIRVEFAVK